METKVVERGGEFVVIETLADGTEEERGRFATMADAEARENELEIAEREPDKPKAKVKREAKAAVPTDEAAAAEQRAKDRQEDKAE